MIDSGYLYAVQGKGLYIFFRINLTNLQEEFLMDSKDRIEISTSISIKRAGKLLIGTENGVFRYIVIPRYKITQNGAYCYVAISN